MKLKIYLADLVYDTIKTNYAIPLNIGYIAAYLDQKFKNEIELTLFKYPTELEKAIKNNPPDILGMSNYSWNTKLNLIFINLVKRLKKDAICVLGGPNIRIEIPEIKKYLESYPRIDYYILHEGEEPFGDLVEWILNKKSGNFPKGCATVVNGKIFFEAVEFSKKTTEIKLPSPYLNGLLDAFLADQNMIPLLETNRGCPFGCVYCAWGIAALSRIRLRDVDIVKQEINYIAEKSAKQPLWIFCDANFGIFERDIEIAKSIREVMDAKGCPRSVTIWHSKNTGERNIEISKIIKSECGFIAIQSADKDVLRNTGRGAIKMDDLKKQIDYYKDKNMEVMTDILIGLPGESSESHLKTLCDAYDLGFDVISPMNIRMLPGSKYDTQEYREKYGVKTKYRPIFGAYGIYDDKLVFELEESIRATKEMNENELNDFKVIHWLIYFAWNGGIFKPLLSYGQRHGINPAGVLYKLSITKSPALNKMFKDLKNRSQLEWFNSPQEMIEFYSIHKNFDDLTRDFTKLNQLFTALFYQDSKILQALQDELLRILRDDLKEKGNYKESMIEELINISNQIICKDLLESETNKKIECSGEIASILLRNKNISNTNSVVIEIYRPKKYVSLSHFYLNPNGKKDFSIQNLTRYLEIGGLDMLTNKIRLID